MTSYKMLLDPAKYLNDANFPKPREMTIARIVREQLPVRKGEPRQGAPMLYLIGKDGKEYARPFKVPKSVMFGLSIMLGTEIEAWAGKKITLFATRCLAFGDVEPCIRVQFSGEIEAKIRKWLRKRKAPQGAYMLRDGESQRDEPETPQESAADRARAAEMAEAQERGEL